MNATTNRLLMIELARRVLFAAFFVAAGLNHFRTTGFFSTSDSDLWVTSEAQVLGVPNVLMKRHAAR